MTELIFTVVIYQAFFIMMQGYAQAQNRFWMEILAAIGIVLPSIVALVAGEIGFASRFEFSIGAFLIALLWYALFYSVGYIIGKNFFWKCEPT